MKIRRIVLAGGSGFLGRILGRHFLGQGHDVAVLTRSIREHEAASRGCFWDACALGEWSRELDGADVLINLAGRSVNCRYHARNRKLMLASRVDSTRVLGEAIARCTSPPAIWLNSSTATIYKHSLDQPMDESGEIRATPEAKDAFSIEVATAWERAFNEAQTPATRKIALRSAMVLGQGDNSVFPVLCRLVRLGLGGRMASGNQYVSWIHESDFCRAIDWLIECADVIGPVNLAAPIPIPNHEMMATLRDLCGVSFGLPATEAMLEVGAFFLRTETELMIKSRRVVPSRLLALGFEFRYPRIREAMAELLTRAAV